MPFRPVIVNAWVPGRPGERPPVDPGWGVDLPGGLPDQGLPGAPGAPGYPGQGLPAYPDQGLPGGLPNYPSHGLPRPPRPGAKPPGLPVLPIDPDWSVPAPVPPIGPGDWHPIDPGYGMPPVWGFLPVDPGFGVPEGGTPTQPLPPTGQPGQPTQPLPPPVGPTPPQPGQPVQPLPGGGHPSHPIAPGHWLPVRPPVDPSYGVPSGCPGDSEAQPKWVWIPEIGHAFGVRLKKKYAS